MKELVLEAVRTNLPKVSAAENDLPVRFFSFRNEFGFDYCDALLDTEASIKATQPKYSIDAIGVVCGAVNIHECERL